jgi:cardiolipin synthase A/B
MRPRRRRFRVRTLAIPLLLAVLAVVTFTRGGSAPAPGESGNAGISGVGSAQPGSAAAGRGLEVFIEPAAGFSPVYDLIESARRSVDMTMYEFADITAEQDLAADARRGVPVRVILDRREQRLNAGAYSYLSSHGVKVTWSSPRYYDTHQKTIDIDGVKAAILTANLTSEYYRTSRDFIVVDTSPADVSAITAVFNADFTQSPVDPGDGSDLVWSPTNAQQKLLGLIDGATTSLRIYSEEMDDTAVEKALIRDARRRVDVQICGENADGEYDRAYAALAAAGAHISYYSSPDGFYIHGKVVEADYGTPRAKVFIGSENFSNTSLNDDRELGLITSSTAVATAVYRVFVIDFRNGHYWP